MELLMARKGGKKKKMERERKGLMQGRDGFKHWYNGSQGYRTCICKRDLLKQEPVSSTMSASSATVRDILKRVAVGDDVSDFSDLSDSDEEERTVANNAVPGDASDDDEPV
ncbi:hypothetical protein MRX96_014678 [Rhipicephalus microplus]